MSDAAIDLIRRFWEVIETGYEEGGFLEGWNRAVPEFCAEDIDYEPIPDFPEALPRRGQDQLLAWLHDYSKSWEYVHFAPVKITGGTDDRVLVKLAFRGTGRSSGATTTGGVYQVFTVREGKIVRAVDYVSRSEARRAAGLE